MAKDKPKAKKGQFHSRASTEAFSPRTVSTACGPPRGQTLEWDGFPHRISKPVKTAS